MSQIVKTNNGFGVEVPVCAGIKTTVGAPTEELIGGQIVVTKYPTSPQDAGYNEFGENAPTFIKDPDGNIKPLNKIFPITGKNMSIQRSGAPNSDKTIVGGFTVNNNGFQGTSSQGGGLGSQVIENFTADQVKVILESDSYGDYEKMLSISPSKGQVFFLITEPEQQVGDE